jgi:NTE family protein
MMSEEEMSALIKAGERATWPQVPMIDTTTRIGRTLDGILHAFEIDQAHWLRTAPQTDAALATPVNRGGRTRGPAMARRGGRVSSIIDRKAKDLDAASA